MKIKKSGFIGYVLAAIFTAFISVCAFVFIPTSPPITMQTCGIFLALLILGGRLGTISVCSYVLLGCLGLPIFSGFTGGVGVLLSSNGGYILGFLIMSLIYWIIENLFSKAVAIWVGIPIGLIVTYILGALWFCKINGSEGGFLTALLTLSIPFAIPDILKLLLSVLVAKRIEKVITLEKTA